MKLEEAKKLAEDLMLLHGLLNWKFKFDRAKKRLGSCHHTAKTITLSRFYVELNHEDKIINTILHEIAHALVGAGHGHDAVWRQKALEIGCDGARCSKANAVEGKYKAVCPHCKTIFHKFRKPKRVSSCGICCSYFDKNRILVYQ